MEYVQLYLHLPGGGPIHGESYRAQLRCNVARADFRIDGSDIVLGPVVVTERGCEPVAQDTDEIASALGEASRSVVEISENRLMLQGRYRTVFVR